MRPFWFIIESTKPFRFYLWGIFWAIFIVSIDANLKPYLLKKLIDTAASEDFSGIWILVSIFALSQLITACSWTFSDWCATTFNAYYRTSVASHFVKKVSTYSYSFFQNTLSGSIVAKINDAFNLTLNIIFTINYYFIQFILTTLITLFLLMQIHILFALGLLLWILTFCAMNVYGMKTVTPLMKSYAEAKSKIFGHIADYLTNMQAAKLFATSNTEIRQLDEASQEYSLRTKRQGYFMMKFYFIVGMTITIYICSLLFLLIHLNKQHLITPGDFALVFMLNFKMIDKLLDQTQHLRDFITNWGTVDQALSLFENVPEVQDIQGAKPLEVRAGKIVFDQVEFAYNNAKTLFRDLSITIEPGQKVGLVGYSGGGKSTFVNLILRLYDLNSGAIMIDDQDIKVVSQESLRQNIGMIPQDPSLFHRSLLDNIGYGKIDASHEQIFEASKRAHTHEFITKLPLGYKSMVGERGVKLSGGQRQRVAIARAILKDAPILILDEATSQLDSMTESAIQDSLWQLMEDKTVLVIAHRLSTLLHMDRILVFDNGRIIEDGSHGELLAKNTVYKTLWDAQVGGFLGDENA